MRELFIYYRIAVADASTALASVLVVQAGLQRRHPGLTARLLRRADEQDNEQTWMEIYAFHPDRQPGGVSPEIEADIAAQTAVLAPFIVGRRHTESFTPCAS